MRKPRTGTGKTTSLCPRGMPVERSVLLSAPTPFAQRFHWEHARQPRPPVAQTHSLPPLETAHKTRQNHRVPIGCAPSPTTWLGLRQQLGQFDGLQLTPGFLGNVGQRLLQFDLRFLRKTLTRRKRRSHRPRDGFDHFEKRNLFRRSLQCVAAVHSACRYQNAVSNQIPKDLQQKSLGHLPRGGKLSARNRCLRRGSGQVKSCLHRVGNGSGKFHTNTPFVG